MIKVVSQDGCTAKGRRGKGRVGGVWGGGGREKLTTCSQNMTTQNHSMAFLTATTATANLVCPHSPSLPSTPHPNFPPPSLQIHNQHNTHSHTQHAHLRDPPPPLPRPGLDRGDAAQGPLMTTTNTNWGRVLTLDLAVLPGRPAVQGDFIYAPKLWGKKL